MRSAPASILSALGYPPELERLYDRVVGMSGQEITTVAPAVMRTPEQLVEELSPLVERGIVRLGAGTVEVLDPAETVTTLLASEVAAVARAREHLSGLARAVPLLTAAQTRPGSDDVDEQGPLEGEVTSGGDPLHLLSDLVMQSRGDLLWFRPDAWRMPRESAMAAVIGAAVASGRRSRAIYPAIALQQAPEALRARAEAGEQVRVIAELPTRLLVIGTTHAVVPEPLGFVDSPRVLVRQRSLVQALGLLFELMWERASPVPGLDRGEARPDLRRLLLQALAQGAKDEQIARTLGISLRTVRRRVASLMAELGADSRFQAGVEAGRRGWI